MNELEKIVLETKRTPRSFIRNIRGIMIVFILFVVTVVTTTDIRFVSFADIAALSLNFFLLLFSSYLLYVCASDNGTQTGLASDAYKKSTERFDTLKKDIIEHGYHTKMRDFCTFYIKEDLKTARMQYIAVIGMGYDEYLEKYANLDRETIDAIPGLTPTQKRLIKKANKVKPIKLTPEMIMRRGRGSRRRSPLEMNPETKKTLVFGEKFIRMTAVSIGMTVIAFDVVIHPSWVMFVSVCLKLVAVTIHGFEGYKAGYDNIAFDTVNYQESQSDLMAQAFQYIKSQEETPTPAND